jgi:hypothetical protein
MPSSRWTASVQNTGYEAIASAHAEVDIDGITGYIAVKIVYFR